MEQEQTVWRVYTCQHCGKQFSWNEEIEEAQAPDECDECREEQEAQA